MGDTVARAGSDGEATRKEATDPAGPPGGPARLGPAAIALVALVLAKAGYFAYLGAGLVLDDWRLADNTVVYGIGDTLHGGHDSVSRPVAWLWFNSLYAVADSSPGRLLAAVTVLNAAVAVLLLVVFSRLLPRRLALAVAAVWVLLPTHTALSVWGAITQALLCLVLFLAGTACVQRGRWRPAAVFLVGAVFSYQTAIPLVFVVAAFVPARPQLAVADRVKVLVVVGAATLWSALHPTYPPQYEIPDVPWLWRAHFGTGIFVSDSVPVGLRTGVAVAVLAGVVVAAVRWVGGHRRWDEGPSLVLAGVVVWASALVVLVALPLWIASPEYGIADRVFGLSSVGSAMVLVGLGAMVWRRRRPAAVAVGVAFCVAALSGQYVALHAWSDAAADAEDLLTALGDAAPEPHLVNYAVGPGYPSRNSVAALDPDSVYFAHKLRYGGGPGTVAFFEEYAAPLDPSKVTLWWADVSDDLPARFYDPTVSLDQAFVDDGGLHLTGWALDRTDADPVGVRFWITGSDEPAAEVAQADELRPDLDERFGLGARHGFDLVIPTEDVPSRPYVVCAQAFGPRSRPGARRVSQACQSVHAPGDSAGAPSDGGSDTPEVGDLPLGLFDRVEPTADGLYVAGWALDPGGEDPTAPIGVAITVDGRPYGPPLTAAGPRPDLASWGLGADHGLDGPVRGPVLTAGTHEVCLVGPLATATPSVTLHCLDVEVG